MQNVVSTRSFGWFQLLTDQGRQAHWVHKWTLTLECGHQIDHLSEPRINRGDVAPPAWVRCPQCAGGKP